jgi:peptidoglycan biosynthesis protein MviN/MurJ (putative lipid II flippase)
MLIGLLAGMPLVATGITLSQFGVHWCETVAACVFSATCVWFALEQARFGLAARRPLLIVASASLIAAMTLATLYALRHYWAIEWISIDFMIRAHGPIQVFGFALPGVVAWVVSKSREHVT